ncbi:MAG TPA: amino acid permease [Gemmatimonadota bacterium]
MRGGEDRGRPRGLLRILGVASGVAVAVSGTIGSGIFRTPGVIATQLGDAYLILGLWVLGGVVFTCGALTYAELGSRYPESGGLFNYIRRAYGDGAGSVYGWLFTMVIGAAPVATLSVVFGEYVVRLAGVSPQLVQPFAVGAIVVFTVANLAGLRWGAGTQNVLTLVKILGMAGLVIVAFLHPPAPGAGKAYPGAERYEAGLLVAFALAFQSVIYAYDGFGDPLKVGEEIHHPERNLPRSLIGGVLVITAVYLALNGAFLWSVPLDVMARSNLVAGEAAARLFGRAGDAVIVTLAIVSVLGTLNTSLLVNPRVAYATARAGLMPKAFTRVNAGGTPTVATLWTAAVGLILALSGTFEELLTVLTFAIALGEVGTTGSLFVFRSRDPRAPSFRVPGYPVVPGIFLLVNLGFALSVLLLRPAQAAVGSAVVAAAALGYVLWRRAPGSPAQP